MRNASTSCLLLVCLSQGCVGDDPAANNTPVGGGDGGTVISQEGDGGAVNPRGLTLSATPIEIVRGQPATFTLNLTWSGAPTDVSVTVVGPPGSTASAAVVVPQTAATQTITLSTDATLAYGDQTVQFTATATGAPAVQATSTMFVRGTPGALDTSFGDQGRATPPPGEPLLASIAVDENGKFHASGLSPSGLVLTRYEDDGRLDTTFSAAGVAVCAPPPGLSIASFVQPWSTVGTGAGYETAYGFDGAGKIYALRALIPDQGACSVVPSVLPGPVARGEGLPQADGLIWVTGNADGVVRYNALGAVDPLWGAGKSLVIPPEIVGATDVSIQVVSASSTRLLLLGRAKNVEELWRGFTLLDRATGAVVTRFASTTSMRLGAGTAANGTSYLFAGGASFLRIAADGTRTTLTSSFGVAENELNTFGSMSFTAGGAPVLLITNTETQLERAVLLDENLQAIQSTVNLEAPHVVDDSMTGARAIVDSKRRIIVFHQYDDDAQDPSVVSAHWMIRRYWL